MRCLSLRNRFYIKLNNKIIKQENRSLLKTVPQIDTNAAFWSFSSTDSKIFLFFSSTWTPYQRLQCWNWSLHVAAAASDQTEYDSYKIRPFEVQTCRWFDVNECLDHLSYRTFEVQGTEYACYVLWIVVSALVKCLLCCWSWAPCAGLKASHSAGHIKRVDGRHDPH